MKLKRRDTNSLELKELTRDLQNVLSNISLDNMKVRVISGELDTEDQIFNHDLGQVPELWFLIEGDVFVPFGGLEKTKITVSPRSAGKFRLALVK
jgi:hypothetical protein